MSVADAAVPSPPLPAPPPTLPPLPAPMLALVRAAADASPYLSSASMWVLSASLGSAIVARRVWGEGSAPLVFLEALTGAAHMVCLRYVCLFLAKIALLLCLHCLAFLADIVCDLVYEFSKSAIGQQFLECFQELDMSPRTAVLGGVAYVSCILLIVTGYLVSMMSSPVEGSVSQGEKIGSMIMDVGTFGIHATSSLVFIPTFAWREVQSYRRRSLLRQCQDKKVSED